MTIETPKGSLELWLGFVQALFWPITVLIGLVMFKAKIGSLLGRISSLKIAGNEVAFQPPSEDAKKVDAPIKGIDVVETSEGAFLNETGVRAAVRASGTLAPDDEIYRAVRIFLTRTQATWIVFSKTGVACVLDDANARSSGRLLQWSLSRQAALPVRARVKRPGVGLVDIGSRQNWLYSTDLFPTPEALENELKGALAEGGAT